MSLLHSPICCLSIYLRVAEYINKEKFKIPGFVEIFISIEYLYPGSRNSLYFVRRV